MAVLLVTVMLLVPFRAVAVPVPRVLIVTAALAHLIVPDCPIHAIQFLVEFGGESGEECGR